MQCMQCLLMWKIKIGESENYKDFTMFIESEHRDDFCTMTECMMKLLEIPNSGIE